MASMDLEMPDKTTQDFDGPGMVSRVDPILGMSLAGEEEDITFSAAAMPSPYLHYGLDGGEVPEKVPKKKSSGGRPRSAARQDGGESKSSRK